MSCTLSFGPLRPEDHEAVARLLHRSLVHWYESRLGQGARFGDSHEPFRLFPQVYEALDPGEAVTAWDSQTGQLIGVCFSHERETHIAVGIVATAPEAGGRGVARQMMQRVLEKARPLGKPVRLVSSLMNLDSFSLYTRLGFVPGAIFQDLLITVPESGLTVPAPPSSGRIRLARAWEAVRIADFEYSLRGIRREKDFNFFLRQSAGSWEVLISERDDGSLGGFLAQSTHPASSMLGPGVFADEETATALLWQALDARRGCTLVFLIPCTAARLVQTAYSWGARNVELHVAQSTSPALPDRGIVLPTFLPETA